MENSTTARIWSNRPSPTRAFADFNLTSANSINFGRILPQIIYYIYAWAQLAREAEPAVFSVPSGNFGDALGCEYARRMGLPVEKLVMPTNENDEFPRFLETGVYEKLSPSRACLSNAMNVGHPSNLARFFDLYGGTVDRTGIVHRIPDIGQMRKHIYSVSISDRETKKTIKRVYDQYGCSLNRTARSVGGGLKSTSNFSATVLSASLWKRPTRPNSPTRSGSSWESTRNSRRA